MRFLFALSVASLVVIGDDYYVAPYGDDGNDGTSTNAPFLTISAAQLAVRSNTPADGHTVYVRDGWYQMPDGLTFTTADSGGAGAPVIYRNYPNETPVLINGNLITNMVSIGGGLYSTDVSTQSLDGIEFGELYLDYERLVNARHPNVGSYFYTSGVGTYTTIPTDAGDIPSTWADYTLGRVTIYTRDYYTFSRNITGFDSGTRVLSFESTGGSTPQADLAYWINGIPEALDAENEWVLTNNVLTLYPSGSLSGKRLYAPTGGSLFTFETGVSNIWLRGLTMTASAESCVMMEGSASHNRVLNCYMWGSGSAALTVAEQGGNSAVFVEGGVSNWVHSCDFRGQGGSAIQLRGGTINTRTPTHHLVENNSIYGGQEEWIYFGMVRATGVGHQIRHNYIQDCAYSAIHFNDSCDILVEANYITNAVNRATDGGAIYTFSASGTSGDYHNSHGSYIIGNVLVDIYGQFSPWRTGIFRQIHGIYLDGYSTGLTVVSNVVDTAQKAAIVPMWGRYHVIQNNMFIQPAGRSTGDGISIYSTTPGMTVALPSGYVSSWMTLTNQAAWADMRGFDDYPGDAWPNGMRHGTNKYWTNIIYSSRSGVMFDIGQDEGYAGLAGNTYYSTVYAESSNLNFYRSTPTEASERFTFSQWTNEFSAPLELWGDPLIIPGTYTLDVGSPALSQGFQQIDWESAGTYESEWQDDGPDPAPIPPLPPVGNAPAGTKATLSGTVNIGGTWQ